MFNVEIGGSEAKMNSVYDFGLGFSHSEHHLFVSFSYLILFFFCSFFLIFFVGEGIEFEF